MYKKIYYSGFIAYAVMIWLAALFFKERTVLTDTAYTIFYMVKDGKFAFQHFRCGDIVTQWIVVAGANAQWPLKDILTWYSIGSITYYLLCYVFCGSILKQYELALAMLLVRILFLTDTFYYEIILCQGIIFFMLAFACLRTVSERGSQLHLLLIAPLFAFSAFFHPLLVPVVLYIFIFFSLRGQPASGMRPYLAAIVVFFVSFALKELLLRSPYEVRSMGALKNFVRYFPNYFTLYSNERFLKYCLTRYCWIPITFIATVWHYYKSAAWMPLGLFVCSFFGYLFLVNICYPGKTVPSFYIEGLYIPLGVILSLPFVYDVLPRITRESLSVLLVLAIMVTGCIRMFAAHTDYSRRLQWERSYIAHNKGKKVIAKATRESYDVLQMVWATPYEFWLLSTIETGKTTSIILDDDPAARGWARDLKSHFVVNWNIFPYSQLPPKYFRFTDTVSGYSIIK